MRLRLGGKFPRGWSQPSPVLFFSWPFIKYFPAVWVENHPATDADIEALRRHQGKYFKYDKGSIKGKDDPDYTTERDEYLEERQ